MDAFPLTVKRKLVELSLVTPPIRGSSHAACLVHKKMILSYGYNQLKSHPMTLKYGKNDKSIFLHAELDAIVKCINKYGVGILEKSTLYVLRTTPSGVVRDSCPCAGCARAIKAFKIKKVIHT